MKTKQTLLLLTGCALLAACTSKRPYDELPKEYVLDKVLDTNALYLYTPSETEAPRTVPGMRPHFMGDPKLVRFQYSEKALKVLEVERDGRFKDNPTNEKPVLSIPIQHLAYKCAENSNGECTNKEEVDDKTPWEQRPKMKVDFGGMKVLEAATMPIALSNVFGGCYPEVASDFKSFEIAPEHLNIEVETTYTLNLQGGCFDLPELISVFENNLSDMTFNARAFLSIIKLSDLASADYKAIDYPKEDENTFGFFTTSQHQLSVDNRDEARGVRVLMDRWNPKRQTITYVLNAPFQKPENKTIREATFTAIRSLNKALKDAGTELQIELKDATTEKAGDIRHNMIVMVEDPTSAGVIGYGPHVSNPLTGEILHARTVMYLGTIKAILRRTYDELVEEINASKEGTKAQKLTFNITTPKANPLQSLSALLEPLAPYTPKAATSQPTTSQPSGVKPAASQPAAPSVAPMIEQALKMLGLPSKPQAPKGRGDKLPGSGKIDAHTLKEMHSLVNDYHRHVAPESERLKDRFEALSQVCAYPAELINFDGVVRGQVAAAAGQDQRLPTWDELSEEDRTKLIDMMLPTVWIPVLVHEMGHNLGLRHNFSGSEDKDNFYSEEELKDIAKQTGVKVLRPIPYSSVMDYSYRSINELPTMGKYDIAALRFGYERKVLLADGKNLVDVPGTLDALVNKSAGKVELKEYRFCTDEHVAVNAGCKRFDEGTNLVEIVSHFMNDYEAGYKRTNFRNGRRSFSIYGEGSYKARQAGLMYTMRVFFQAWETIKARFSNISEAEIEKALPELRQAAALSGAFMISTLMTPDLHCALAKKEQPDVVTMIMPMHVLNGYTGAEQISCFAERVKSLLDANGLVPVAQGGKPYKSLKDPESSNSYADQIDVRGIKIDKELALAFLLSRTTGVSIFDRYDTQKNYLDDAKVGPAIIARINEILFDRSLMSTVFRTESGESYLVKTMFDFSTSQKDLLDTTLKAITTRLPNKNDRMDSIFLLEMFEAYRSIPQGWESDAFDVLDVGSRRFMALPENRVARAAISATKVIQILKEAVREIKMEGLRALIADIKAGKPLPADASEAVKAVANIKVEVLDMFTAGFFNDEDYYVRLLDLLPNP